MSEMGVRSIIAALLLNSSIQKIMVDTSNLRHGDTIPLMKDYVPEPGLGYPSNYRITDCWQCFDAQGKVCMEANHDNLFTSNHITTSKGG